MLNSEIPGQRPLSGEQVLRRAAGLLAGAFAIAGLARWGGLAPTVRPMLVIGVFAVIIGAIVLFWSFRLAIAFIGVSVLLAARVFTLQEMLRAAELEIILFLVGMMTLVAVLKDLGLFSWMIQLVINMRRMNGPRFVLVLVVMSALLAGLVDEVTSVVFVLALVFQVCDTLKLRATPFVLIAVMATNIGSSGTMLGNPVGVLIGTRAGFTFLDFIRWAAPVMVLCLLVSLFVMWFLFRKDIALLSARLEARRQAKLELGPIVSIPYRRALAILIGAVVLIASHHHLENLLGVERNTFLIVLPLAISGLLMVYRRRRARHYIESEVDWWELLFYMMLFAVAGALSQTEVTARIAERFELLAGDSIAWQIPLVLGISAVGSALVDNIVFVAAFVPVMETLGSTPLWWALLFGACLGGNITLIGSTANIVAAGMVEKRYRSGIRFREWIRAGLIVGGVTLLVAWGALTLLAPWMPQFPVVP